MSDVTAVIPGAFLRSAPRSAAMLTLEGAS